MVDAYVSVVT